MVAAHKQFIHGFIEQSRERVVQVRAGQSLANVLETGGGSNAASPSRLNHSQHSNAKKKKHKQAADASLPNISSPTMGLVYEARRHASTHAANQNNAHTNSNTSAMRTNLRKRSVVTTSGLNVGPPVSSVETTNGNILGKGGTVVEEISSVKFHEYMDSKTTKVEALHQYDRRKAIAKSTRKMQQLAGLVAAAEELVDAEAAIARTLAAVKGKNAFKNLKTKPVPSISPDLQQAVIAKNPHFAFLDFMHEDNDRRKHARVSIGLDERNTKKRTPIHFGDQICFISDASDLPLSIGGNGRTCRVQNLSVGPHMMFTIVDFRNPTRHTEVTTSDEFWLRVDTTLFDPDWGCSADEYDVRSLLSDTQFFLGCAGSIDDERDAIDSCFSNELSTSTNEHLHGTAGKYALPRLSPTRQKQARRNTSESHSHDTFRLVAMKATIPAVEYYGDDKATREYTMETNEHIMRLARWKFVANDESIHGSSSLPKPHNTSTPGIDTTCEESLLLNCTSVYLSLNHFIVEYERDWERAVMRDYSKRCNGLEEATDFLKKRGKRQALLASWQIRLLHQGLRPESPTKATANSQFGPRNNSPLKVLGEITASPIEWLRTKHELMEKNEAKIKEKRSLVRAAKQSYEQVAKQSNSKLAEIEQRKAQHQLAYFQNRYHTIFAEDADERTDHG